MEIADYLKSLSVEGRLLAAEAERAGPGSSVPTCPGWQMRHLLRHTGMVHRWAAAFVTEGHTAYHPDGGEPDLDGGALLDWFRAGHHHLVEALAAAPADLDCWTFMPAPSPLAFWARRQLHETAVHRADAESALGGALTRVGTEHALDGIDELLTGFHARPRSRVRTDVPRTLRVRALGADADVDGSTGRGAGGGIGAGLDSGADAVWTVRLSAEPPKAIREQVLHDVPPAECELSGTAEGIYLTLWNRLPLSAVTLTGDRTVARLWTDNSAVTWN
ncbi:maleylpyruvate isomerase family mycothiol-dependent enzyme [Streptomyces sp. NBC_01433]|uniref:maleylpyruvate isomerase family mycothiol-dependent enzyme n=1 Tax=Streptomyces sp. NBC_01433 TaxID=2903864 RepID=UPI0022571402|nr:maleylpyruvate isomerase family mycothiol-dependent enzyme [Streptomyces sp. NBC_01433]MCX4678921.1 maleylpyruvate isomerase family mycothiol-dependent enzyme [Streptomyces sp. NBC_01433]